MPSQPNLDPSWLDELGKIAPADDTLIMKRPGRSTPPPEPPASQADDEPRTYDTAWLEEAFSKDTPAAPAQPELPEDIAPGTFDPSWLEDDSADVTAPPRITRLS